MGGTRALSLLLLSCWWGAERHFNICWLLTDPALLFFLYQLIFISLSVMVMRSNVCLTCHNRESWSSWHTHTHTVTQQKWCFCTKHTFLCNTMQTHLHKHPNLHFKSELLAQVFNRFCGLYFTDAQLKKTTQPTENRAAPPQRYGPGSKSIAL